MAAKPQSALAHATSKGISIDAEARARGQQKAREARTAAANDTTFRRDFLDDPYWQDLSRARGVRLPQWGIAPTVSKIHTWLHKLGISLKAYREQYGKEGDFIERNPSWPLRAIVGLMLEMEENNHGS